MAFKKFLSVISIFLMLVPFPACSSINTTLNWGNWSGQEKEKGKRYELDLGLNQADLATLVGARREWVNRILRDWQQRGLILFEKDKLFILDLPRVIEEHDSRLEANTHLI